MSRSFASRVSSEWTAVLLIGMIYVRVRRNPALAPEVPFAVTWGGRVRALRDVAGITFLVVLILGGMYLGFVTATEAAALGAFGALGLMALARQLTWANFCEAVFETSRTTGMVFLLLIGAAVFSDFMALSGLPQRLSQAIAEADLNFFVVLGIIAAVYLFLGCFLDSISMMVLTLPVLLPVLVQMDVNLIWFGIILVKLVEIGAITPPFGITVYVVKGVVGAAVPLEEVFRGIGWFLVMEVVALVLLIAFPQISLLIPNTMLGRP